MYNLFSVKRLVLNHNNLKISGRYHHRRLLTNFESLEELHLTNAFTEVIDSKWYLDDLKDILLTGLRIIKTEKYGIKTWVIR